jgi:glycosyltransferase involved in cell wall biosynthesis
MRIGLNLAFVSPESGGLGRYAHELVPALLRVEPRLRLTAFIGREAPRSLTEAEWTREIEWVRLANRPSAPGLRSVLMSLGAQWGVLAAAALRRRLQVVHGLAYVVPPIAPGIARVVTVPDVIWARPQGSLGLRGTVGMRVASPVSVHVADRVIAISRVAATDISHHLRIAADRIDVVPLGVRVSAAVGSTPESVLRERLGLGDDPVLLCTAALRPHKNLLRLVDAHRRLRSQRVRLVLAGSLTGHERELREAAARAGTAARLHILGFVSELDLEGLYRLATGFVLPSLEEGFGLPVLEAMARALAVACSDTGALADVVGDAALKFDPLDPVAIAAALDGLLERPQLRSELVDRGLARAATFSWEATAGATLASYERAVRVRSSTSR